MSSKVKFYLNHTGVANLKNSEKMQNNLKEIASKIQAQSGGSEFFDVKSWDTKDKYGFVNKGFIVSDYDKDISVRASNNKHNRLKK
jgi:hypothetical protein